LLTKKVQIRSPSFDKFKNANENSIALHTSPSFSKAHENLTTKNTLVATKKESRKGSIKGNLKDEKSPTIQAYFAPNNPPKTSLISLNCLCGALFGSYEPTKVAEVDFSEDLIQLFQTYDNEMILENGETTSLKIWEISLDSEAYPNVPGLSSLPNLIHQFNESFWRDSTKTCYIPRVCASCGQFRGFELFNFSNQYRKLQLFKTRNSSQSENNQTPMVESM
jgi:hypothetical protein